MHFKEFADWFHQHIAEIRNVEEVSSEITWISRRPSYFVKSYNGYILNGVKFHTTDLSTSRKTQNNGVFVSATTSTYLRNPNDAPSIGDLSYYGTLENVFEVSYGHDSLKYPLFRCKWYDGLKTDEFGIVSVKTSTSKFGEEPFIFAEQAQQCFYIKDPVEVIRSVVLKVPSRELFDMNDDN